MKHVYHAGQCVLCTRVHRVVLQLRHHDVGAVHRAAGLQAPALQPVLPHGGAAGPEATAAGRHARGLQAADGVLLVRGGGRWAPACSRHVTPYNDLRPHNTHATCTRSHWQQEHAFRTQSCSIRRPWPGYKRYW